MKYVLSPASRRVYETNSPKREVYRLIENDGNIQLDILEAAEQGDTLIKVKLYLPAGELIGYVAGYFITIQGNLFDGKFNKK